MEGRNILFGFVERKNVAKRRRREGGKEGEKADGRGRRRKRKERRETF